jgi:hypothetical protein
MSDRFFGALAAGNINVLQVSGYSDALHSIA